MTVIRMFLEGREVFADCGNGLEKVMIEDALKLIDKCIIYASLTKNSKATPVLGIHIKKDVDWRILLTVSIYVANLAKSLGLKSTYTIFYWLGSQVLIHEDSLPIELFKRFPKPIEAGYAMSNYILKVFEDKLVKISRFFKGRIWFSTDLDKLIVPCSFVSVVGKRAIYIDVDYAKELEPKVREELCVIGEPFRIGSLSNEIKHKLLNEVVASVNVKPITIRSCSRALPKVVGRFEVMALLQAARYYILSGDLDKAKSFGLNRAIFYAWAKYHRPATRFILSKYAKTMTDNMLSKNSNDKIVEDHVEIKNSYFVFSDQIQTPEDFDRSVKRKIDMIMPFDVVWDLTLRYVKMFSNDVLRDPNKFYRYVYEPVRDSYIERIEDLIKVVSGEDVKGAGKETIHDIKKDEKKDEQVKPKLKRLTEYINPKN